MSFRQKIFSKNGSGVYALKPELDDKWEDKFKTTRYKGGDIIYQQGEPFQTYHILLEGAVKNGCQIADGKKILFNVTYPGEVLEKVTLNSSVRKCFARSLTESRLALIGKEDFRSFLLENPKMCSHLVSQLSEKLSLQYQIKMARVLEGTRGALLFLIKDLYENRTSRSGNRIHTSETDLANLLGVSRETISRHLSQLRQKGIAEADRNGISVLDGKKLKKLAPDI